MSLSFKVRLTSATLLLVVAVAPRPLAAESRSPEWLRGSGDDLELRLRGEVLDADGRPATNVQVDGDLLTTSVPSPLHTSIGGHRFELWIPVNQSQSFGVRLRASSTIGDEVADETLKAYQIRQAAIDGLKLKLKSPTRRVAIYITDQGQPVSGAHVKASMGYFDVQATTGADGIAWLKLLPQQDLAVASLMAWTDDHRVGGFQFHRGPPRDPNLDHYTIQLSKCRDQKVRFVAENGSPVSGVRLKLHIATPEPYFNYIGTGDHSVMATDASGEAVYRWFPDWEDVHYYAEIHDDDWFIEGDRKVVDGVAVYTLKERRPRKRVTGRVVSAGTSTGPGGFYVVLRSSHPHHFLTAFSDPDGTFAVDILPDTTYGAYAQDERWVGKIIDVLPYESGVDKLTRPELVIADGQPVEVLVTSGPSMTPVPNLTVSLTREHRFSWHENGEERYGIGGPNWWATTDESGRATTRTLPGKLKVSVYEPRWRTEKSLDIVAGYPARIQLHREIDEKRTVTGRLVLDDDPGKSLGEVEVRVGSVDSKFQDEQSLKSSGDGSFSFDTYATQVAIFAATPDGRAAGAIVASELEEPIELHLHATETYHGQLLGPGNQPVVSHPVYADVRTEGAFDAKRLKTYTDQHGDFTLVGIPIRMEVNVQTDTIDGASRSHHIEDIFLEPNQTRPRNVIRLKATETNRQPVPLTDRYQSTLRDCRLAGYRPLVLIADDREGASRFVNMNYADTDTNPDVYAFMQIMVTAGQDPLAPADAAFLKMRAWPLPQPGHVFAFAIDAEGNELGRQTINVDEEGAAKKAASFVHEHAPTPPDAEEQWNAAFANASRTNRRVWVRVSQRNCGPCFSLSRWLDDQRELLEKDYVMLKIDDVRDVNGKDVAERVYRGQNLGIPFHAIFDASGTMLIDSNGPLGNIGAAGGTEGNLHLRKMLNESRQNITDTEIEQLVESMRDE